MKNFIKPNGSFHAFEDDYCGDLITADMKPISDVELAALRTPSKSALIAQTIIMARALRQPILSILDGMQASAVTKGDTASASALEAAKQGLKDITKIDLSSYTTVDQMKLAVMTQYKALQNALPTALRSAFSGSIS